MNKTDEELVIDVLKASIVSITNESHSLDLFSPASIIPSKSTAIYISHNVTIFGSDIDSLFKKTNFNENTSALPKLEDFLGEKIRLYLPVIFENGNTINYDIVLSLESLLHEESKLSNLGFLNTN